MRQPQSRVARDRATSVQNGGDAVRGHAQPPRQLRSAQAKLFDLLSEVLAGLMSRADEGTKTKLQALLDKAKQLGVGDDKVS